jgi:peptidyl-dipeptidase Dcp
MKHRSLRPLLSLALLGSLGTTLQSAAAQTAPAANPLFTPSTLPYQAPPFDKIKESDYQPAIEEGMKRQLAEIEAIANNPEPPTFANTLEATERTGELLTRAGKVFFNIVQSNANDALQKIRADEAPKLAAHQDAIFLNPKLFARIHALYEKKESLGLDPESKYLLERYHLTFVRAGALLSEADKATLRKWNEEEARLSTEFTDKVLADTRDRAVVVDDKAQLAGLSADDVEAAAEGAKERKLAGRWILSLQNTTQQPALSSLADRALRERLLKASESRCTAGANDTRAIVSRLAQLRAQKAKLLGFSTYAAYILDDQMAKTPERADKLMTDLVPAATRKALGEAASMQKLVDAGKAGFQVGAADWEFYSEKVRKAEYDLDEKEVRPYFELDRVLKDGVFYAAGQLYGITFKERKDIPVYQQDVRVWEVLDADGKPLALYYGDYFARPGAKAGGAWEDSFVDQTSLLGTKPAVLNNTNFEKPAPGKPALLSSDDVKTLFHEFGHALHGMFSNIRYPMLGATPRDFVEMPSQFNEHWALEPSVFARYAKHYETGKPMPDALVQRIKKSRTFNQGYMTTEYLGAALLDMTWHSLPADAPLQDAAAFEKAALEKHHIALAQVPPRYHTTYFSHIWSTGYAAGYYAYLWAEVIDDDAYYWFNEHGGMTRANGQRFRDMILSREGTADTAELYRAFRGRDPVVEPLLEERGLK